MSNNESSINNNEIANNAAAAKKYTLLVANKTGHTTLEDLTVDQAIENITELVATKKNWVFINGAPFEFAGSNIRSEANISKLRTQLEQTENAQVMLTGQVIGG
jgi:hypothetical protein